MPSEEARPRQHALKILLMDDKEERIRYLESEVPEHFRAFVMTHVRNWWPHRGRIRRAVRDRSKGLPI